MTDRALAVWMRAVAEGLYEPSDKRVRVEHLGETVADTQRAVLVWEPRRVVPSYAIPVDDLRIELRAAVTAPVSGLDQVPVLHPGIPFAVHTQPGDTLTAVVAGVDLPAAAFRPADPSLEGYVILDYFSFDAWYEEDERIVGHPRDPFKRIDTRASSRHVVVELDGQVLADSTRPILLFETGLPVRYYLPAEDVRSELLRATTTSSFCAYKGEASYWSVDLGHRSLEDSVWTYRHPLSDASAVADRLAFFDERFDVVVDGVRRARPETEFGRPGGGQP